MLQDVSNFAPESRLESHLPGKITGTVKTFSRRKKVEAARTPPEPPLSPLASEPVSTHVSDSDASCATGIFSGSSSSDEDEPACPSAHAQRYARRSSIIPCSTEQPVGFGTRLVLFRNLPKAKQRSYFQYMQQMAEYYAEVDAYQLVEESPCPKVRRNTKSDLGPIPSTPGSAGTSTSSRGSLLSATPATSSCSSLLSGTPATSSSAQPTPSALAASTPFSTEETQDTEAATYQPITPSSSPFLNELERTQGLDAAVDDLPAAAGTGDARREREVENGTATCRKAREMGSSGTTDVTSSSSGGGSSSSGSWYQDLPDEAVTDGSVPQRRAGRRLHGSKGNREQTPAEEKQGQGLHQQEQQQQKTHIVDLRKQVDKQGHTPPTARGQQRGQECKLAEEEEQQQQQKEGQQLELLQSEEPLHAPGTGALATAGALAAAAGDDPTCTATAANFSFSLEADLAHVCSDEEERLEDEEEQTGPLPMLGYPLGQLAPAGMMSRRSSTASQTTMRRHTLGAAGPAAAAGRSSRSSVAWLPAGAAGGEDSQGVSKQSSALPASRQSAMGPATAAAAAVVVQAAADGGRGAAVDRDRRRSMRSVTTATGTAVAAGASLGPSQPGAAGKAEQGLQEDSIPVGGDLLCCSPPATTSKAAGRGSSGNSSLVDELKQLELGDGAASRDQKMGPEGPQTKAVEAAAAKGSEVVIEVEEPRQHLTPLQQLMELCGQGTDESKLPSMDQLLKTHGFETSQVVKIGEGAYGEAFKAAGVVLKIVPMEGKELINDAPQKLAADLQAEALIALTLTHLKDAVDGSGTCHASVTNAFVQTHWVGVCRGKYPKTLVTAWKDWDKRHESENDPVNGLSPKQLFTVYAMCDCGRDLEAYQLAGYVQARSLLLQVAMTLAVSEEALGFEHRDLHWGNVLLKPATSLCTSFRFRGQHIEVQTQGTLITLIDFTASRLQLLTGEVAFCDLEQDPELFQGPKGCCQSDTYRRMRKLVKGNWSSSHPGTNVLWMHYLADVLLAKKELPGMTPGEKRQLRDFRRRVLGYSNCGEAIWDELFKGLWWTSE